MSEMHNSIKKLRSNESQSDFNNQCDYEDNDENEISFWEDEKPRKPKGKKIKKMKSFYDK